MIKKIIGKIANYSRIRNPPSKNRIEVRLGYGCNFKCEYCYQEGMEANRLSSVLSKENAHNFLDFLKRLKGNYGIYLSGGEPFLYPNFELLVSEVSKRGHDILTSTNFSASLDKIKNIFKIANYQFESFNISVHLSQYKNINDFYKKLSLFLEFLEKSPKKMGGDD